MGTKNNPGEFDCYAHAQPDEPMFILLGRDASAAHLVEEWADMREEDVRWGRKPVSDMAMVKESRQCAKAMREFHARREARKNERP